MRALTHKEAASWRRRGEEWGWERRLRWEKWGNRFEKAVRSSCYSISCANNDDVMKDYDIEAGDNVLKS